MVTTIIVPIERLHVKIQETTNKNKEVKQTRQGKEEDKEPAVGGSAAKDTL